MSVRYQEFEELILTYCSGLNVAELLPGGEGLKSRISILEGEFAKAQAKLSTISRRENNLREAVADADDKIGRHTLINDLTLLLGEKEQCKKELGELRRSIDSASRSTKDVKGNVESLSKLFDLMHNAEENQRATIRLKLRQELRRLIARIDVYPGGNALCICPNLRNRLWLIYWSYSLTAKAHQDLKSQRSTYKRGWIGRDYSLISTSNLPQVL